MSTTGPHVHQFLEKYVDILYYGDEPIEEVAHRMRQAIEAEAQNLPSQMFSNFITRLVNSGINLLNFDLKDTRNRIVGLVVLDCLLDISDEIMPERRVEIANQLRKVLENDKQNIETTGDVIRKAAESIGHLARVASTTEIEFLDFYVTKSIEWLTIRRSDANKFSGVLILTQLAINSPALIFMKRKNYFNVIFDVIFDRNVLIREAAAGSLSAVMLLVSQRESTDEYIRLALHQMEIGCNSSSNEKIHGFLLIFDCLLSVGIIPSNELLNTIRNVNMRLQDMFWEVLQRKDSRDINIKHKVLGLIPKLAALSQATFIQHNQYTAPLNFLSYSVRHMLDVIYAHKDRCIAYLALGNLLVSMAPAIKGVNAIIDDVFAAIKVGFKDPFCIEALDCLSVVVKASGGGQGYVDSELVNSMFQGGLTPELIKSLKVIVKTTPSIRGQVQTKLRAHITNILLNNTVVRDDLNQINGITRRTASNAPLRRPLQSNPPTLLSNLFSSSKSNTMLPKRIPISSNSLSSNLSNNLSNLSNNSNIIIINSNNSSNGNNGNNGNSIINSNGISNSLSQWSFSQEPTASGNELVLALQVLASFDFLPNQFSDSRGRNKSFQSQFSLPSSWSDKQHSNSTTSLSSSSNSNHNINNNGNNNNNNNTAGNECEMLLRVVREGVVRYLDDSNPAIRDAAAITCATVLNKVVDTIEESTGDGGKYLIQVMDRLLMLGVGDECEEIRVHVFLSLPPSLDHIISNSENVHCLIEAMNDESFDVRSAAMSVLARVAHYDTVHVMPLVRLMLSKLMRQLHNTKDHLLRQESVQLLQAMVRGTNVLIVPYVYQIMEPLLALLDDPSSAIVSAAVSTIGELARVSPEDIEVHLNVLFPRLIQALNDQSSVLKQEICVIALGKVVSSLNIVSKPYTTYPTLFDSLVRAIQRPDVAATSLRLQAMRTLGLLGAVDADIYSKSSRTVGVLNVLPSQGGDFDEDDGEKKKDENDRPIQEAEEDDQLISLDKYYLSVVINSLMTIIRDSSLSSHHQTAAAITLRIVRILGFQSDPLLDNVINAFTYRFYHSDTGGALQETLLDHLITMVYVVGRDISRHLSTIVKLTCDCFNTHLLLCLSMVEALCFILLPQDFNGVLREVLPCMVQVNRDELLQDRDELISLKNDNISSSSSSSSSNSSNSSGSNSSGSSLPFNDISNQTNINNLISSSSSSSSSSLLSSSKKITSLPKSSKVFTTIANISPSLGEYRRQLVPVILKVVEESSVRPETRREALCAVMQLAIDSSDLNEFASRIIHPLLRLLSGSDLLLQTAALTSLSCMICRLKSSYLPFVIPAKRKISQILLQRETMANKVPFPQLEEYESLVSLLLKQRPLPSDPSDRTTIMIKSEDNISSRLEKCRNVHTSLRVEFRALEMAWTLSGRTTTSDLVEWMRRLSIEFIRQSPSPILRPCAVLAKVYQPLAHELFNAAFVSVWDEIFLQDNTDPYADIPLISGLEMALRSPQIPGNIRQVLLNLAEFMDMQDKRLPLDIQLLAKQAESANMFAKCLHYREIEFNSVNTLPSSECIEALITVNSQLGMKEAASGVLTYVRVNHKHIKIEPYWLEKLTRWQEARDSYTKQSEQWRLLYPDNSPSQHENWMNSELGILRCLHALGEYSDLCSSANIVLRSVQEVEGQVDSYDSWMTEVQRLGANAAWMLGKWDQMEQFIDGGTLSKHHDVQLENDGTFYEAVFAIHRCDYKRAAKLVTETREAVTTNISSLLSESYSRAYRSMVTMQVLSELEELIDYRKYESKCLSGTGYTSNSINISSCLSKKSLLTNKSEVIIDENTNELLEELKLKKLTLIQKWQRRLQCAPREVDVYRLILAVHTLLVDPKDDLESWLELVTICRKENMLALCENVLKRLGAPENLHSIIGDTSPHVIFNTYKYWWARGDKLDALRAITEFIPTIDISTEDGIGLKVQCLLKRAVWMKTMYQHTMTESTRSDVLSTVRNARELASDHYYVWHAWAVTNYDQLNLSTTDTGYIGQRATSSNNPRKSFVHIFSANTPYVVEAIRGFSRSIALGGHEGVAQTLQDTLRLLTLWFTYGTREGVYEVLSNELKSVAAEHWLGVLPQMIARMHVKTPEISNLLKELLIKVAVSHPQALVYSISVALNTTNNQRRQIATEVMLEMRKHDMKLVEEAAIVSRELMRVAITPHELWHEGLERAAQLYIAEKDVDGMIDVLLDLHKSMEHIMTSSLNNDDSDNNDLLMNENDNNGNGIGIGIGMNNSNNNMNNNIFNGINNNLDTEFSINDINNSLRDISFRHLYGRDLSTANDWLKLFCISRDLIHLHQAWDLYHRVFRQIATQLKNFKKLELRHVSPALTNASNLGLAVPGTYRTRGEVIHIRSFFPSVDIITSKQRPRRMTIVGTDGLEYRFLLKGHEDLRQDERVMQLFGLINVCLENDRWTRGRGLSIVRYSVLPLSNNSGVIGWVENCDTLNALVKQYREARDVKMSVEHKLLLTKAPCYEKLSIIQKVDIFCQVREETTGQDLAKMLWFKSKTSDVWVERRSNYTKSLAVMSMVGYILGLGDRHPSNLMLDRVGGRIVHIDFGDCFEVAMQRSKYPETIPFRLTRMLIKAMEISGIEGTFRSTCEKVMNILRDNRNSVMAMLEAFVYDPLISWRLLAQNNDGGTTVTTGVVNAVEKAVHQSMDSPTVGSPVTEIVENPRSEIEGESAQLKNEPSTRDNLPKLLRLKSNVIESSQETLNSRALEVIHRIQSKLNGRDFNTSDDGTSVEQQVDHLINEATSVENLCQVFVGWCPFW